MVKIKKWIADHFIELFIFVIISGIATPAFFFRDNDMAGFAVRMKSYQKCSLISTQYIKQRCYQDVWKIYRDEYCPKFALNGNVEGCRSDMKARMTGIAEEPKFPLKLLLYLMLEFGLGAYLFYFKEKWSS